MPMSYNFVADSFQNGIRLMFTELRRIELKSHETKFWRHQVDKPATYLSTIEAIYYCAREYHQLKSATGQYCQQYDDLLFFLHLLLPQDSDSNC